MVGGTESGARIYNTKIRRNRAAFPNSIKSRKVKGKDDKKLCGWVAFFVKEIKSRTIFSIFQIRIEPPN